METFCNTCGEGFTASRSDARYCSTRCRVAAHRKRTGQHRPPSKRRPLPDVILSRTLDAEAKVASLRRAYEDDRLPRNREALARRARVRSELDRMIAHLTWCRDQLTPHS